MEGTTEPIIAILGHPIAGNPSQLAIERALCDMDLEWRVLSFDVEAEDVPAALNGFDVLGIRGVLIDPSVCEAAAKWYAEKSNVAEDGPPEPVDCLYRDDEGRLRGSCELGDWLRGSGPPAEQIETPDPSAETTSESTAPDEPQDESKEDWVWIGDDNEDVPLCAVPHYERLDAPPDPRRISTANFILISEAVELETEDWPENDGSTVVIDMTEGHPERNRILDLGYRMVDDVQRRGATLCGCLRKWTGQDPPEDVIRDAIEEYLGV